MSSELINIFTELLHIAEILGSDIKAAAYRNVINVLSATNVTRENVKTLKIGKSSRDKIIEYFNTGRVIELETLRNSRQVRAHRELGKIAGVGPATVEKWLALGVDNIPKLRRAIAKHTITLNHMQQIGLLYYVDLNARIPRAEVTQIGQSIYNILRFLDPQIEFTIAGSYRRGRADSGDVDIIVSNKSHFDDELLPSFISIMVDDPNFVDVMSAGQERITFLYRVNKIRQIDILNIPYGSYFAALNYFTGGFEHNKWLRGIAKQKGYRLNQNGLYKQGAKLTLCNVTSEREIYDILGVAYIEPNDRK
jgi:DNA polymerase/3'-5' exonuclease PolX